MTWFDHGVLIVLGLSMLISIWRGLMRELISLIGWSAGFALAIVFGGHIARMLPESLGPLFGGLLGFLSIFLGVLMMAWIVEFALSFAIRTAKIGYADRALGAVFGLTRGAIIVVVLVLFGGLTSMPRETWWRDAALSGPMETVALIFRPYLPDGLAQRLKYR